MLRVLQTGVQLPTGFLLTLPFQNRFAELSGFQEAIYLAMADEEPEGPLPANHSMS